MGQSDHRHYAEEIIRLRKKINILKEALDEIGKLKTVYSNEQPIVWYSESVIKARLALDKAKVIDNE